MLSFHSFTRSARFAAAVFSIAAVAGCGRAPQTNATVVQDTPAGRVVYVVRDTAVDGGFDAAGVAAPIQQATLSTKLMGSVTEVLVREGDRVALGQPLLRIDARDLTAKSAQVAASLADANAMQRDAVAQATRIRALYADSAATRAQLDAAEVALARAQATVGAAEAAGSELGAVSSYAVVRAPFAGLITKRFVDPGAFAAPGAPLLSIQDASTLRITASTTPDVARGLHRGQSLAARVERVPVRAAIEGVVPASAGNLYVVNALVANPDAALLAGSTATVTIPTGRRRVLLVPASAIAREGDLTGVVLQTAGGDDRRWVKLGATFGDFVEVTSGLASGDRVVLSTARVAGLKEE